jgi:hypothetical protein
MLLSLLGFSRVLLLLTKGCPETKIDVLVLAMFRASFLECGRLVFHVLGAYVLVVLRELMQTWSDPS